MVKLAMLGSGFIGRFYADSIHGLRSKDKIVSIYSRREEQAKKFAEDYGCEHSTTVMEELSVHRRCLAPQLLIRSISQLKIFRSLAAQVRSPCRR